jgi:hypothetical protein
LHGNHGNFLIRRSFFNLSIFNFQMSASVPNICSIVPFFQSYRLSLTLRHGIDSKTGTRF